MRLSTQSPFPSSKRAAATWPWGHIALWTQFSLQILLLFPAFQNSLLFRMANRMGSLGISIFLLVWLSRKSGGVKHPAMQAVVGILAVLTLQLCLHPTHNTLLAALAQSFRYLAILGPVFWACRLRLTERGFEMLILSLWIFHTLSAGVGVLQVYFPGEFQPALSQVIQKSQWGGENLLITLANGEQIYRPMGLTDMPGGAARSGFYTALLGMGVALATGSPVLKVLAVGSSAIGLFCILLSKVRSILILTLVCLSVFWAVLMRQGQWQRSLVLAGGGALLLTGVFSWAILVGGEETLARLQTLTADAPGEVYYQNRGHFLEETFIYYLPKYPLGAGLGRYGTMNFYFGNRVDAVAPPLWAEIQWTAWVYDGGIPLILTYLSAIFYTLLAAWQVAMNRKLGNFSIWGGLMFAYNTGIFALTFNYSVFNSQTGLEFWLLNSALFAAGQHCRFAEDLGEETAGEGSCRVEKSALPTGST